MKPYYDDGDGRVIYHGDCREIMAGLAPAPRARLLLTDPPYNAGVDYGSTFTDSMSEGEYVAWCREWFALARPLAVVAIVFPGHGNLTLWDRISKPSAIGCWDKVGATPSKSTLGYVGWEPYLYWTGDKGMLGGTDVVRVSTAKSACGHPCPKPHDLMAGLIEKARADSVIDPFMGSGTTLQAARDMGASAVGIEINEAFCEIAAQRLEQGVLFS